MIEVPVSATRKLAPVMPISAAINFSAQHLARLIDELGSLVEVAIGRQMRMRRAEIGLDLVAGEVHGGGDDVARMFAAQLDDVFAEIRLDRL